VHVAYLKGPVALSLTSAAMSGQHPDIDIRLHNPETATGLAPQIWPCYRDVFGDFDDVETWRSDLFDRHTGREGYRLAVAMDAATVAGFSWGYVGQRGQSWTDLACEALPGSLVSEWVGGHFEFVELAVLPEYRRRGVGRLLHDTLLAGIQRKCLLSTKDDLDDPAVRLYLACGWQKLGNLRPGTQVMGRDLPGN
jgi:ribosomal protein S18 acetylase RimI-like enzyme